MEVVRASTCSPYCTNLGTCQMYAFLGFLVVDAVDAWMNWWMKDKLQVLIG